MLQRLRPRQAFAGEPGALFGAGSPAHGEVQAKLVRALADQEREETYPLKKIIVLGTTFLLVLSMAACQGGGSDAGSSSGSSGGSFDTQFPLPSSVSNFMDTGGGSINFQTTMSLPESVEFYRNAMGKAGLIERPILTVIGDTTFSMVFDGDPSGKAVVVQGVYLDSGMMNINIRYEAV